LWEDELLIDADPRPVGEIDELNPHDPAGRVSNPPKLALELRAEDLAMRSLAQCEVRNQESEHEERVSHSVRDRRGKTTCRV
jgi:hypothetical protein